MAPQISLLMLILPSLTSVPCPSAFARENAEREHLGNESNILLFIEHADNGSLRLHETLMATELKLAMDSIEVKEIDLFGDGFGALSLTERIDLIRPIIRREHGIGAVWLTMKGSKLVLTIAYMSDGRALIEVVEHPVSTNAEPDLAMAVKEILEASRILPATQEAESTSSSSKPGPDSVPATMAKGDDRGNVRELPWRALLSLVSRGGIMGYHGPSTALGAMVGLERSIFDGFSVKLDLSGGFGPATSEADKRVQGWSLATGLCLLYAWSMGSVEAGPSLGLDITYSNIDIQAGFGPKVNKNIWRFHATIGMGTVWFINETLGLSFDAALEFSPQQYVYRRLSNEEIIIASPLAGWKAALGVVLLIGD
ncbi:MAG: hypothetical protein GXP49_14100 [Deltaproteobacteria bacterium]|nr:hypothetical protein [Deltaproteobacteria bacterium]